MIYLDEERVAALLDWDELIDAMEQALAAFSKGAVIQPVRTILKIEERARYFGVMPAVLGDVIGAKFVTFYPSNAEVGLHTHHATIVLYSKETGSPLSLMDGRLITEMRTAAVSAAITKYLAAPNCRILALLGSGVQARAHLAALSRVRAFDEVRVWSRTAAHARRFAAEHHVTLADSAEAAVRGADVVVTATSAHEPVLRGAWLKRGAHVNAVGSAQPQWRELDTAAMRNLVVVDSREAAACEAGDVILAQAIIRAEAGEIFSGAVTVPATETTIFKSLGLAVEDVAAAKLVYEKAL